LSETAKVALLQEVMREAKRNERSGLAVCIIGVIVAVAGLSTTWVSNGINLGIIGIVVAGIGFIIYLYYGRVYLRFIGQLALMVTKNASPCPKCGKPLPEGEFAFCPHCGSSLK